jgi:aminopeptidase N
MRNLWVLTLLLACPALGAKPRGYDVQHYRIETRLRLDGSFENRLLITLAPTVALSAIELDAVGLTVTAAGFAEGGAVPFVLAGDAAKGTGTLTLKPGRALPPKKPVTFAIDYSGQARTQQEGLFVVNDPSDPKRLPYFFTHFQPDHARRFFPSNDVPHDKATTEVLAVVDGRQQVLSNGTKVNDEAFSQGGENLRRVHWKQEQPHSPYLVALAVGQFTQVDVGSDLPATLHVLPGTEDRAHIAADFTRHALGYQRAFLGVKYPWAKHDQVTVPSFTWGGMENTSLVLMRLNGLVLDDRTFLQGQTRITGLVAHELAHQWFGDLVTCKSWSDVWLNEGFATYLTWRTLDAHYDNDMVEVERANRTFVSYFRLEDGPRARPLVERKGLAAGGGFDSIAYTKGAQVLRMLEQWVGEPAFQKGLKAYLEKYAHQSATSEDFFAAFAKATGTERTLTGFRDAWLFKKGYPIIEPEASWSGDTLTVTIRQRPNHADEKGPFVFKLPIVLHRESSPAYAKQEVIVVDKPQVTARFKLEAAPQWVNWNQDGTALAKVHPPALSEQSWIAGARKDPDPVWRLLSLYALLGELVNPEAQAMAVPSDAAMDAVLTALRHDPSPYVREAVLERLATAQWRRLPELLSATVLELAKRPQHLSEDPLGRVRVRRAALWALGKFDAAEGRRYLLEQLMSRELDLNYLPAAAKGAANLGDSEALATLRAAVNRSKGRGPAYFKHMVPAVGSFAHPEVIPVLRELLTELSSDHELSASLVDALRTNEAVTQAPEFAALVKGYVLQPAGVGEEVRERLLARLDRVKTHAAKEALQAIAKEAPTPRLQASAAHVLEKNFPAPPPAMPAKGKKR